MALNLMWKPTALLLLGVASMIVLLTAPVQKETYIDEYGLPDQSTSYEDAKFGEGGAVLLRIESLLAGSILLTAAGGMLLLNHYIRNQWFGMGATAVGLVGMLFQVTAGALRTGESAASVFSTMMGDTFFTSYAISPFILAVLGLAGLYLLFELMPGFGPEAAQPRDGNYAYLLGLLLFLGVMLPIVSANVDDTNPFTGEEIGMMFGAPIGHLTELGQQDLQSFIQLFMAAMWIGILSIWVHQAVHMIHGEHEVELDAVDSVLKIGNAALFAAVTIYFVPVATWLYDPGTSDTMISATYLPGWFNFALIPLLIFWGMRAIPEGLKEINKIRADPEDIPLHHAEV